MEANEADDLQLPYLVTFSKAAELCNFSATAKALRLSQAAVSQRVQALEKILGKSLFHRRGGRVLLTEAGQTLYEHAQRILECHREARRCIAGQETPLAGELILAASSVPGEHLLPALLPSFRRIHPHVHVKASVADSTAVMAQVERGEASLGLVGQRVESPHLEFRHFASDRMVLVMPPSHTLGKRKKATLAQLASVPLILRESGSGLRDWFEKALLHAGRSVADLTISLELGSNEGIKEAVLRGLGAAILSTVTVQKELQAGTLVALEISGLNADRELFVVRDRRRVLPLPARLFISFLEGHPVESLPPSP